ncbi:transglycosylase SLT domain-containing protein [Thiothrix winogradskyi]|uniref:Transglycosylase SLT domain-containing protein n=1 Tax=Thiothrix winogradskyi TaxID=96472 RepID=A0ABY3SZ02_9GAMM|nr:transglycosylase SLT domain-containing protein [Thiothrix winogradskyi]UJS23685.1 transglycosylase SLT domain-containing protein [Thiothrix winogradskyi]
MKKIVEKLGSVWLAVVFLGWSLSVSAAEEPASCVGFSAKTLNQHASAYQADIKKAANRYSVNPSLIKAVMATGSCFNHAYVSPDGRVGLMQLQMDTAKRFGAFDVFTPEANIDAGTRYLSYLLRRYQGSQAEVLAAYVANSGTLWHEPELPIALELIQEPVKQHLATLLKLDGNKKANRQAVALLKKWVSSTKVYHTALAALPQPDMKAAKTWFQSRLTKVHYPRTPEARGCGGFSAKTLQTKAAPYEDMIKESAKRHGVNPALVKAVIAAESCYREMVVSYKGASGLMQLMPETAAELGVLDIFDPQENINGGTRYLSWLVRRYDGSVPHAIAAYNAGPGRITPGEPITITFTETRGYIHNVLTNLTKLEQGKKSVEQAHLLLAGWEQTELEYQAALRGETLAVAEPEVAPVAEEITAPNPGITLAFIRTEKVLPTAADAEIPPNVHLISAIDQGIVRVKHIKTTELVPAEAMAEPESAVMPAIAPIASEQPEPPGLQTCEAVPAALLTQTEQRGSGRYGAFFYAVQAGDTLEQVAQKLGVNADVIMQINNVAWDQPLRTGVQLKVAECARGL